LVSSCGMNFIKYIRLKKLEKTMSKA
jgi:hypothetical protein